MEPILFFPTLCDKCGFKAKSRVYFSATGQDLLFCGHHTFQYQDALIRKGAEIYALDIEMPTVLQ